VRYNLKRTHAEIENEGEEESADIELDEEESEELAA
jgi:hypothetical protein